MLAFSYIRFSSKRQASGDSYRRQFDLTKEWCDKNGYVLAEENFRDLGVSGWTGENWREGGLALFLDAVKRKKVQPGSCLIVENLDRLSRDEIDRALTVFCDILRGGVTIVTLKPERVYTRESLSSPTTLMEAILGFILANEESSKKSGRLKALWVEKRKRGGKAGALCPAWLRWDKEEGVYRVIEEKADVVRLIHRLSADGLGSYQIIRILHERGIGSIGKGGVWNHSYISRLLHHRAVIGEGVMSREINGRRVADVFIPNYCPPIIDKALFYRVQAALTVRDKAAAFRGRGARNCRNLFTGLIVDARDGGSLVYLTQRKPTMTKRWTYLVSHNAMRRVVGACYISFPYGEMETAILLALPRLTRADFIPPTGEDAETVLSVKEGELAEVRQNIDVISKRIIGGASAATLVAVLEDLDAKAKALSDEVERLKGRTDRDPREVIDEISDAMTEMKEARTADRQAIRERLQGRLRLLIDKIYVLLSKSKSGKQGNPCDKHALIEIRLRGGGYLQVGMTYSGGECETRWPDGPTITKLPKSFDVTDPYARL